LGPLSWIALGLIAGWIAGALTGQKGRGCITTTVIGVLGAFVGGALANAAGYNGAITDFSLRAIVIAALGAALLLLLFGAIEGRRR
jgi:uncharacterized membrane protein YeaQ/YmgE (transglycosylase-associated protein family)